MLVMEALRLARRAFFKPFKLDEELREAGSYLATNVPIWHVRSSLSPDERRIIIRALVAVALGAIVWPLVGGLVALWLDDTQWWLNMTLVTLTSLLFGATGLLLVGISFGMTMGAAVSLAGSLAAIIGIGPTLDLIQADWAGQAIGVIVFGLGSGLALGLILGLAAIATFTLRPAARWFGGVCAAGGGLVLGTLLVRTAGWGVNELAMGIILATFFAPGFIAGFFLGHRRLPFYLIELVLQIGLTGLSFLAMKMDRSGRLTRRLYLLSPVRKDELIWFPLWTLDRQLTWLALVGDRSFARDTITKIGRSFRQSWAAEAALADILAHDLCDCQSIPDIAEAADRLDWFPRAVDLPTLALRRTVTLLNEVSQNAEAAIRALDSPGWRINLGKAQANLKTLQEMLFKMDRRVADPLSTVVQHWENAIEQALRDVPQDMGPVLIENLYISGNPIPTDKEHLFVGREDLFARIEENLAATQKPTLVLHGQRRTGKSSLLLQLPNRLPADYVPVYVDLQATAPVDSLNRFLYTLARETVRQADKGRRIALPPVELEDFDRRGTHAFYEWLERTRQQLDGRLLLFALDEFEKIEEAIERDRLEEAVLDLLRHLIQHHSHWLVFLFAGVRTLEEMSRDWHSYFISVRPLHVSYLDKEAARKLILLPTETHPIRYDGQAVEIILEATRAQPFLVQAVCFELIQYLNSRDRRLAGPFGQVTLDDAQNAIHRAVRSAKPYFQDLWASSSDPERLMLAELAYSQREWVTVDNLGKDLKPKAIHQAVEQLKRRELIERNNLGCQFQIPMMRQWIREEVSLDAVRVVSQSSSEVPRGRGRE